MVATGHWPLLFWLVKWWAFPWRNVFMVHKIHNSDIYSTGCRRLIMPIWCSLQSYLAACRSWTDSMETCKLENYSVTEYTFSSNANIPHIVHQINELQKMYTLKSFFLNTNCYTRPIDIPYCSKGWRKYLLLSKFECAWFWLTLYKFADTNNVQ